VTGEAISRLVVERGKARCERLDAGVGDGRGGGVRVKKNGKQGRCAARWDRVVSRCG
jgi:hypothetical protein